MSASQCFALCLDCYELHYGIPDSNGVYQHDSASSTHWDHACHVFGAPDDYPQPIRYMLLQLHAGRDITDLEMWCAALAAMLEDLQPTNGIRVNPRRRYRITRKTAECIENRKANDDFMRRYTNARHIPNKAEREAEKTAAVDEYTARKAEIKHRYATQPNPLRDVTINQWGIIVEDPVNVPVRPSGPAAGDPVADAAPNPAPTPEPAPVSAEATPDDTDAPALFN